MSDLSSVTRSAGFPGRDFLTARYAEKTGRSLDALPWYQVLATWKAAIFLEGSYRRFGAGTTEDPYFASLEAGVPDLAALARARTQIGPEAVTLALPAVTGKLPTPSESERREPPGRNRRLIGLGRDEQADPGPPHQAGAQLLEVIAGGKHPRVSSPSPRRLPSRILTLSRCTIIAPR